MEVFEQSSVQLRLREGVHIFAWHCKHWPPCGCTVSLHSAALEHPSAAASCSQSKPHTAVLGPETQVRAAAVEGRARAAAQLCMQVAARVAAYLGVQRDTNV